MQMISFCFFQRSLFDSWEGTREKRAHEISSTHTHTPKQSSKCHSYPQVLHSFVYYTCDRSSLSPLSAGWMVVFTLIPACHTQGASLRGCLQDKATPKHPGWMCLRREEGLGCGIWEWNRISKYLSRWWSINRAATRSGHMTWRNRTLLMFIFFFFF